jgi:protein-L-isoaspartate(D-aspartate) O-methyltransferase
MPEIPSADRADSNRLAERRAMVEEGIASRGVRDPRILRAFLDVPRHLFVPASDSADAYGDFPVPIGHGATVSQPYIVARMVDLLELRPGARVLEIGTGSGYQTAILSLLAGSVVSIERVPQLASRAQGVLDRLGVRNIRLIVGDGSLGAPDSAPFDGITVTAAAPSVPRPLLEQLADGGVLVIPVGEELEQVLLRIRRNGDRFGEERLDAVRFVPLLGRHGFAEGNE